MCLEICSKFQTDEFMVRNCSVLPIFTYIKNEPFPNTQFLIPGLERSICSYQSSSGGGILLYTRKGIPY